jgi:hypothetical protein
MLQFFGKISCFAEALNLDFMDVTIFYPLTFSGRVLKQNI